MTEKFLQELEKLTNELIDMAHLAQDMLDDSVRSLKDQNVDLAREVVCKKTELAEMDVNIEQHAFRMIALYQPMAKDMRRVACALKLITYLNRIGRYGKDIANVTIEISNKPHVAKMVSLPHMSKMVRSMVDDAIEAYKSEDISRLDDFADRDDDVDAMRHSIFRECLSYMMEDPSYIVRCTHYVMIARYLERCADHACKMAEKITYMKTGEHIEIEKKSESTPEYCPVRKQGGGLTI